MNRNMVSITAVFSGLLLVTCISCDQSASTASKVQAEGIDGDLYRIATENYKYIEPRELGTLNTRRPDLPMKNPQMMTADDKHLYVYDAELRKILVFNHRMGFEKLLSDEPIPENSGPHYCLGVDENGMCYLSFLDNIFIVDGSGIRKFKNLYNIYDFLIYKGHLFSANSSGLLETPKDGLVNVFKLSGEYIGTVGRQVLPANLPGSIYSDIHLAIRNNDLYVASESIPEIVIIDLASGVQSSFTINEKALKSRGQFNLDSYRNWKDGKTRGARGIVIARDIGFIENRLYLLTRNKDEIIIMQIDDSGGASRWIVIRGSVYDYLHDMNVIRRTEGLLLYLLVVNS
jgi:hypothetical protein